MITAMTTFLILTAALVFVELVAGRLQVAQPFLYRPRLALYRPGYFGRAFDQFRHAGCDRERRAGDDRAGDEDYNCRCNRRGQV